MLGAEGGDFEGMSLLGINRTIFLPTDNIVWMTRERGRGDG